MMKKLWFPLFTSLAILVFIFTYHTKQGPQPENPRSASTPQSQTNQTTPKGEPLPAITSSTTYPHEHRQQADKPDNGLHSNDKETAKGAKQESYRYEGDILFPYLTWQEKMKMYYHGRTASAVRYPLGLDIQGVQQFADNVYSIDEQEVTRQAEKYDLMSQAKIDDENGSPTFTEVVPGGFFDRAGIISGDQITSLDGNNVHSYEDLYTAYQNIQGKNEVTLNVLRNGHPIEFTYYIH